MDWRGGDQGTSPPAIAKDVLIVGSSIADNWRVDTGRGIVRGFDARTGKLRWTWDPIPWALETKPHSGAGNAWSMISVDVEHDLAFVPTGRDFSCARSSANYGRSGVIAPPRARLYIRRARDPLRDVHAHRKLRTSRKRGIPFMELATRFSENPLPDRYDCTGLLG